MKISLAATLLVLASYTGARAQNASTLAWENEAASVSAELTNTIESKAARAGSEVLAVTTTDVRLDDGTPLPKGSRLIGHIIQVQPRSGGGQNAYLVLSFDHAVLQGQRTVAVQAMLQAMAAPSVASRSSSISSPSAADGLAGAGIPGADSTMGPATPDGAAGVPGRGLPNGEGLPSNNPTQIPGPATAPAPDDSPSQAVALAGSTGSSSQLVGRVFPVGNLPGVTFSNAEAIADGPGGTAVPTARIVVRGQNRNFSLTRGTRMNLSLLAQ